MKKNNVNNEWTKYLYKEIKNLTFKCKAKEGTKKEAKCNKIMDYEEIQKHVYKHHEKRLFKCTLCKDNTRYETAKELKELHWM